LHCSRIEASWPRPISWGNLLMSAENEKIQKSKLFKALPDQPLPDLKCRTRTRVAEMRPTSHTLALGSLFITRNHQKRKPQSKFSNESLRGWFGGGFDLKGKGRNPIFSASLRCVHCFVSGFKELLGARSRRDVCSANVDAGCDAASKAASVIFTLYFWYSNLGGVKRTRSQTKYLA
jgi:hypothetical protein